MLEPPYKPGSGKMPPLLVGRDGYLTAADALLARLWTAGEPGTPLVLTGQRGVGKTVLLQAVADRARQAGLAVAWLTLDRGSSTPERLARQVAATLDELVEDRDGRWARVTERLKSFSVQVSLPGVTVTSTRARRAPAAAVDRDELTRLLVEAAQLARDRRLGGLVLVLDEVQEARAADLVVLVNTLQDTIRANAPIATVAAGLLHTPDVLMTAGSFAERFTYQAVGPLSPDESVVALVHPARRVGVEWHPGALDAVLGRAQGSPYLLQLFGDAAWTAASPDTAGAAISPAAAAAGLRAAEAQLWTGMFRGRWHKATRAERNLLLALAAVADPTGTASFAAAAQALGRQPRQLGPLRSRLIDKGIVAPAGHGRLAFTIPGFEDFVRAQETAAGDTPRTSNEEEPP